MERPKTAKIIKRKMKKVFLFFTVIVAAMFLIGCSKKVTITFVTNSSESVDSITIDENSALTNVPNMTQEGKIFDGWYFETNFNTKYTDQLITDDIVLYGKWSLKEYKVSFYSGTKLLKEETVEHGKSATAPTITPTEGLIFEKWSVDFSNVTSELTVMAQFKTAQYEVRFYVDGDIYGEVQLIAHGKSATAPTDPVKEGFVFSGWDKQFNVVQGKLDINAIFTRPEVTVKFYDGEELIKEENVIPGESATAPFPDQKEGKIFIGWDKEFSNVTEDISVYAQYETVKYTVTFYEEVGKVFQTYEVEHGSDAPNPGEITKDGYVFTAWDKEFTNITADLDIYAIITLEQFNITYHYISGNNETAKYTINDEIILPASSTSNQLVVWHLRVDLSDDILYGTLTNQIGHKDFYERQVSFDYDGGKMSWTVSAFDSTNTASKGLENVSDLPKIFEQDLYTYLKNNNLLTSSKVDATLQASTWSKFSSLNPLHNNDPERIWNDTSTNTSGGTPGYIGAFLYEKITFDNATGTITDVQGGFLGTEPYRTRYFHLTQHLALMNPLKYANNPLTLSNNDTRNLVGFVIDGYFYGTQGAGTGAFASLRGVVPSVSGGYVLNGTSVSSVKLIETTFTSDLSSLNSMFLPPVKVGYVFTGWTVGAQTYDKIQDVPNQATLKANYQEIG